MNEKYVLIQYFGDEPLRARLESGAEKIEFKTGDAHFAHVDKAKHLVGAYKFKYVDPIDFEPDMILKAKKRLEDIQGMREANEKDLEKARKASEEKAEKEVEKRAELKELKDKYNSGKLTSEKYQEEKAKVEEKWQEKFETEDVEKKKRGRPAKTEEDETETEETSE